jgi:hypothetical protein
VAELLALNGVTSERRSIMCECEIRQGPSVMHIHAQGFGDGWSYGHGMIGIVKST